jgi:hypothetical protein
LSDVNLVDRHIGALIYQRTLPLSIPSNLKEENGVSATICGGYAAPVHKATHRIRVNYLQLSHNSYNWDKTSVPWPEPGA